jgi:hypothetical protein
MAGLSRSGAQAVRALPTHTLLFTWAAIWSIALATRILGAIFLPNAELDAYSYVETIARLSARLTAGHFRLADLFDFWLPLFPFSAGLVNVWVGQPLLVGKILSALCGAASCVLVFAVTLKLTRSLKSAWLAFALIVLNPLHNLYSASAMTDVPHAALILASLWFALDRRWVIAAIFAALAETMRIEAWVLIIVLPVLQLAYERRISIVVMSILFFPLLLCVGISKAATDDPFAFFAERVRYLNAYLDFAPSRRGFSLTDVWQDLTYFFIGANLLVFLAMFASTGFVVWRAVRSRQLPILPLAATIAYAGGLFGFWFFVYVTRRQPLLIPRYGLIFFALGLPLAVWLLQAIRQYWKPWIANVAAAIVIAFCAREAIEHIVIVNKVIGDFRAQQKIARALAAAMSEEHDRLQSCFSDDPAVRVLSRLSADQFIRSKTPPPGAVKDAAAFEWYLQERHVAYLVFMQIEDSLPVKFYPELGNSTEMNSGKFQPITVAASPFGPAIWLYRVRNEDQR